jgi:hypothetical protein
MPEKLAKQKRVRIILDNVSLHHSASDPKPEDERTVDCRAVPTATRLEVATR